MTKEADIKRLQVDCTEQMGKVFATAHLQFAITKNELLIEFAADE